MRRRIATCHLRYELCEFGHVGTWPDVVQPEIPVRSSQAVAQTLNGRNALPTVSGWIPVRSSRVSRSAVR